ncbi:MAG TPA: TetR/AcrR family transcriptional regulator [Candidatus Binataceae bacterium]|nr:TetR/AcrR family transcriptional regulator [Candidatus Binataceae bacterium]
MSTRSEAAKLEKIEKRPRTHAERTGQSDQLMIRAAIRLIARQGYFRTTLAEIGRAAGYSQGLVSYRFGSKEGLLRTLVKRITNRFWRDQMHRAIEDRPGLDALCAMVDTYLKELVARESRLRAIYVLMGEALGPVPEIRKVFAELNARLRAVSEESIRRGIAERQIRADIDPASEAAVCVALLRGVSMQWLVDPGCFDLATVAERVKATFRRSLAV